MAKKNLQKHYGSIAFFLGGFLFMVLINAIKYLTQQEVGLFSLMLVFLAGGGVSYLSLSKHTSFGKNIIFLGMVLFVVYTIVNPFEDGGGKIIINKLPLLTVIVLGIMFLESEVWNAINRWRQNPQSAAPKFIGSILLFLILLPQMFGEAIGKFFSDYWYLIIVFLLVWMPFVYFLFSKKLHKVGQQVVKGMGKKR